MSLINTMSTSTVLIMGVTGKQGSATANVSLNRGFHVRALTRNDRCPADSCLTDKGIQVVQGRPTYPTNRTSLISGIPHWDSKVDIVKQLKGIGS